MNRQRMPFRVIAMPVVLCSLAFAVGLLVVNTDRVSGVWLMGGAVILLLVKVVIQRILWKNGYLPRE